MIGSLVFNHHSLPFDCAEDANLAMQDFLKICLQSKNEGFSTILLDEAIDQSWFRVELSENYFWQDWYNQNKKGKNKDITRAFRSIATQRPFFSSKDIDEGANFFEVSLNKVKDFSAVRAAAWHNTPLVGFATRQPWDTSPLIVSVDHLDIITEEMKTDTFEVLNLCTFAIFEKALPYFCAERNALICSREELFECKDKLFPLLTFCGKAPQQLKLWSASMTIFEQVKQSLAALNKYVKLWQAGLFLQYSSDALIDIGLSFRVSGESQTVRNNPSLRKEREFWTPEGREVFFENHIKLSNGYRLHFYPDNCAKKIYVGYIGPHLRLK